MTCRVIVIRLDNLPHVVDRLFVVVTGREHCSQGRVWVLIKLSLLINKYCGGLNDLV